MKGSVVVTAVLACLIGLSTASAQGVKAKKAMEAASKGLMESAADATKKCGKAIKASADVASFGANEADIERVGWCEQTVSAVGTLCEDADYKAAIKEKVNAVVCKWDKTVKGGSDNNYGNKLVLKGGTLTHHYNNDSSNMKDKAVDFLKSNL